MAKKEAYFWRGENGRGEIKIDRLYKVGEQIPYEKMDSKTFKTMVEDGRIQKTAFDVNDSNEVSDLAKKVKQLSEQIVELNKEVEAGVKPVQAELATANAKIEELEEAATAENPLQGELDTAKARITELEEAAKDGK